MKRTTLALVAFSVFGASQMEGPSLGWMWDREAKSLRRLAGIPGSLRNEAGTDLGEGVMAVWIAPGQAEAIVARDGGIVERLNLMSGEASRMEASAPEAVVFSPDGKKAALWWEATSSLQMWGEEAISVSAKAIAMQNDGEILVLEDGGVLRSLRGAWLGSFGDRACLSGSDGAVTVAAGDAIVRFEREAGTWVEKARRQDFRMIGVTQLESDQDRTVLTVGTEGEVLRWSFDHADPRVMAESGVKQIVRLRQPGFYLAMGDTVRVLFALQEGQKLYELPGREQLQ